MLLGDRNFLFMKKRQRLEFVLPVVGPASVQQGPAQVASEGGSQRRVIGNVVMDNGLPGSSQDTGMSLILVQHLSIGCRQGNTNTMAFGAIEDCLDGLRDVLHGYQDW